MLQHFLLLFLQVFGRRVVHIRKELGPGRFLFRLCSTQGVHYGLAALFLKLHLLVTVPKPTRFKKHACAVESVVVFHPVQQLFFASIPRRIVRGGVVSRPVGHCFDQHWPLLLLCDSSPFFCSVEHSEQVVAVDADGFDTKSRTPACNAITAVLFVDRSRDRIAVVATEEHDWRFQCASKIHCCVEIALAGSPISKVANRNLVCFFSLEPISRSDCLRDLGAKRRRNGVVVQFAGAIVDRHLSAFAQIFLV
mmetsp:Transcript_22323/g.31539  ORF Transcript_22323/g.31539 Transcript_22323/m.31539 type:complete len:251 (+) Transcript_22323:203-955(+)